MREHLLCDRKVAGSIPGWVIPKTLKMVLAALSLFALSIKKVELELVSWLSVSCDWVEYHVKVSGAWYFSEAAL